MARKAGLTSRPGGFWVLKGPPKEEQPPPYDEEKLLQEGTLLPHEAAEQLSWVLWDGDYEKEFYWVKPPEGGYAVKCWPNAGWMNTVDGSGRMWKPEAQLLVSMIFYFTDKSRYRKSTV